MNVIFFVIYFLFIAIIIANAIRVVKTFRGTNNMFDNINNIVKQRYNSVINNSVFEENKVSKDVGQSVNLDDFMKTNSNPIKEAREKRSKV